MRINKTSAYSAITAAEGEIVPNRVQVLRIGKFNHPQYGFFEITSEVLSEMKANFDANIRGVDMCFDYYHDSDQDASGWVKALELSANGAELWATVDWTPKAKQKLAERELRYFSPDFAFKWQDPEKGTAYKNVLFGGGLVNRPFVKEMQAIVAEETIGDNSVTDLEKAQAKVKELEKANLKLSEEKLAAEAKLAAPPPGPVPPPVADANKPEENDEIVALKKTIADLQAQLAKAKGDADMAMAEKAKSDAALVCIEKEKEFNVLLSEGKACVAQKEAFVAGNMGEFIKLAQPLNLRASGSSNSSVNTNETTEAHAKIIKLAEEKHKANPKTSYGECVSLAKKELKL